MFSGESAVQPLMTQDLPLLSRLLGLNGFLVTVVPTVETQDLVFIGLLLLTTGLATRRSIDTRSTQEWPCNR